jgi:hypothetical protein
MTTETQPDPNQVYQKLEQAITGVENDWPATQPSIVIQGNTYTSAQLGAKLQQEVAPLQAVIDARSTLRSALNARDLALPTAAQFIAAFFSVLPQYLPAGADTTKFGSKPKKPRTALTVAQKQAANAKRAATRAARHIMGKKQRAAIQAPATPTTPAPTKPGP